MSVCKYLVFHEFRRKLYITLAKYLAGWSWRRRSFPPDDCRQLSGRRCGGYPQCRWCWRVPRPLTLSPSACSPPTRAPGTRPPTVWGQKELNSSMMRCDMSTGLHCLGVERVKLFSDAMWYVHRLTLSRSRTSETLIDAMSTGLYCLGTERVKLFSDAMYCIDAISTSLYHLLEERVKLFCVAVYFNDVMSTALCRDRKS